MMLVVVGDSAAQGSLSVSAFLPVTEMAVPELALGPACATPWLLRLKLNALVVPPVIPWSL